MVPQRSSCGFREQKGFSLVIVLAAVALLVILMVAFLSSVSTDLRSSKVYSSGSAMRLLSESAANLAIGQIRVATSDASLCWASQPGMIRTFNTQGQPAGYYKLYSDSGMQGTGGFDPTSGTNAVPSNWYSQKGVYVDLNQPVTIGSTNYFPILDGDAADLATFTPPMEGASAKGIAPLNGTQPTVEGFWLKNTTPLDSSSPNQAPMPVKWLYVLQDGKVIVPNSNNMSGTVTFDPSGAQPSANNKIVGRIAFWTDDETCKVNINTASEGTFWDSPRTYTVQDYWLAMRQPVVGEFQRYPGHPAQVCLSSVLGLNSGTSSWLPEAPISREDIYAITPATKAGGSQGGTVDSNGKVTSTPISRSVTRLYTSVDEFMFQRGLSGGIRQQNSSLLTVPSALDSAALKKSRFFLTASSEAPDVNVFNLPRVSMWPITLDKSSGVPAMTAMDKLLAFCGTINNSIFYFQRQDPNSMTNDLPNSGSTTGLGRNRQLLEYLRTLTAKPIPGFTTNTFASKYGDDRHQILTEMFDYIRATNLQDSTTGAKQYAVSFDETSASSPSYHGGKGQVLPITDNTISVLDKAPGAGAAHPRGFGRFPAVQQAAVVFIGVEDSTGAYTPAVSGYPGFPLSSSGTYATISGTSTNTQRVQAGLFIQMFDPSSAPAVTYPWYEVEIVGADSITWSDTVQSGSYVSMQFPGTGAVTKPYTLTFAGSSQTFYGGVSDFRNLIYLRGNSAATNKYPFICPPTGLKDKTTGTALTCPDMTGSIYFGGGNIVVKVYALDQSGARQAGGPVSTSTINFPTAIFPQPKTIDSSPTWLNYSSAADKAGTNLRAFYDSGSGSGAIKGRLNMNPTIGPIGSPDSVRAVLASGDLRQIAARAIVPSTMYDVLSTALSGYADPSVTMSHMLRYGLNFPVYGGAGGRLVAVNYSGYQPKYETYGGLGLYNDFDFYHRSGGSATYARSKDALVSGTSAVMQNGGALPGDWDNGLGNNVDGAFINKADEGDAGSASGNPYFELDYGQGQPGDSFFTPNRMIPSPGMFGSLPTGIWAFKPWQTLLFRPGPANHPGLSAPADHLFLDLFNMPVVEPYAISTPLATAGRINMNYQIVPFTYIHRDTGLRAAMKSQMVTVIPSPSGGNIYKNYQNPNAAPGAPSNAPANVTVRYPINAESTLSQFQARFDSGDIFRSASEICSIDLVPTGAIASSLTLPITRAKMDSFWNSYPVTGDNSKERPYTNLYPLLTTKSNTFTVHMRVQTLKQIPGGDYTTWREGKDQVTGQYRGSELVERYIDPKDTLPDYAVDPASTDTLSQHYKFRALANRQFAP
ncbi:hypothetical protein BH09VER1_BH09VER1_19330 [soil metagenome]